MIRDELELQVSLESVVKLRRIREGYRKGIPESEMRNDVIEGIDRIEGINGIHEVLGISGIKGSI